MLGDDFHQPDRRLNTRSSCFAGTALVAVQVLPNIHTYYPQSSRLLPPYSKHVDSLSSHGFPHLLPYLPRPPRLSLPHPCMKSIHSHTPTRTGHKAQSRCQYIYVFILSQSGGSALLHTDTVPPCAGLTSSRHECGIVGPSRLTWTKGRDDPFHFMWRFGAPLVPGRKRSEFNREARKVVAVAALFHLPASIGTAAHMTDRRRPDVVDPCSCHPPPRDNPVPPLVALPLFFRSAPKPKFTSDPPGASSGRRRGHLSGFTSDTRL
ncbi:hypothetical protein QR685DRAFT_279318 [Neurospora intermedia]|uniref:Uncharacterized protein n=1 Tax=Neurospora intermedia TaxID=5142 RepID=A0ABR3DEW7_NEUIN